MTNFHTDLGDHCDTEGQQTDVFRSFIQSVIRRWRAYELIRRQKHSFQDPEITYGTWSFEYYITLVKTAPVSIKSNKLAAKNFLLVLVSLSTKGKLFQLGTEKLVHM